MLTLLNGLTGLQLLNFIPATVFTGDYSSLPRDFVVAASGVFRIAKSADYDGPQAGVGDSVMGMADSLIVVAFSLSMKPHSPRISCPRQQPRLAPDRACYTQVKTLRFL